ncbi:MAG: hypothetical protein JXQ80_09235, partial [Bacteroidales bacterium]|nr:hypothetical protein [Bacteroidales bacterium]
MRICVRVFILVMFIAWTSAISKAFTSISNNENGVNEILHMLEHIDRCIFMGDLENARKAMDLVEKLFSATNDPDVLLSFRYNTGQAKLLAFMGENARSLQLLKQTAKWIPNLKNDFPVDVASCYGYLGTLQQQINLLPEAISNLESAIAILNTTNLHNSPKQMLLKARLSVLYHENLQIDESRLLKNECTEYLQHYPDPFNIDLIDLYLEMADAHVASVRSNSLTEKYTEIATHILENNFPPKHYRFAILNYLKAIISSRRLDYTNAVHYYNLCINTSPSVDRLIFFQIAAYQNLATLWLGENNP